MPSPAPAELSKKLRELEGALLAAKKEGDELKKALSTMRQEKEALLKQIDALKASVTSLSNEKQELLGRIERIQKEQPSLKIEDMAGVLRSSLESLQAEMKKPSEAKVEALKYVVDKFEVEVKSGLELKEGSLRFVQPRGMELTPESLSTVRISLKATPRMRVAKD